jgi:hypothetical protein
MFSSSFAIVLIGSICPTSEGQWGIEEAFSIFDHMINRGLAPAVVYQEHLTEMNDFRLMLQNRETIRHSGPPEPNQGEPSSISVSTPKAKLSAIPEEQPLNIHQEQELIWSWISMESNDLGIMHPDTMQSAITGLNPVSMTTSEFDADNQWLWGNYVAEDNML